MPLSTGQILKNRYRIETLLGQGGFGAVYKAWDLNLDEPVALKESFETSPSAKKQFLLEAKLLFRLRHPNLPRVHDMFVLPDQGMYLIMDCIEGENLSAMLDKTGRPLPEAQVLQWIGQVCDALEYMHSQNPPIIHRDIKPANIKITPQGKAMLVDFGIAKVYEAFASTTLGAKAVTPGYSPVEQYGGNVTDTRTDIYSLGATLYHALTGYRPPESVKIAGGNATLRIPRQFNNKISQSTEASILKSMETDANNRFQTVAEFKASLRPSPPAPAEPIHASQRRLWIGVGLGGLGLVCLGMLGLLIWGRSFLLDGGSHTPTPESSQLSLSTEARQTKPVAIETTAPRDLVLTVMAYTQQAATQFAAPDITSSPHDQITDEKGVPMALVPAGEFQMGSDFEKLAHSVSLDAFYMDVYEVTNARYAECVSSGACKPPTQSKSSTRDSYYGNSQYADYPVIYVTWEMSKVYCEWRGGSLPSEAEWEKAARGGLKEMDYPWGNEKPVCEKRAQNGAKFDDDAGCNATDTESVGSFSPNGYGLFDMAGNVSEWVWDWYSDSYYSSQTSFVNPFGPDSGDYRVVRGGSWNNNSYNLRVALRYWYDPSGNDYNLGFRCSRSP